MKNKSNYNSSRKPRTLFNSRPVLTETAKEITEQERIDAANRLAKLKKETRENL